ncbi:MAG TPA: hypothetical protein VHL80_06820, partial [Polyangia bacterium]|nr:hypothetical protein [Polyangia bacterium]
GDAFMVLYEDGSVAGLLPVDLPPSWSHDVAAVGGDGPLTPDALAGFACVAPAAGGVQCVVVGGAFPTPLDQGDAGLTDPALAPQHPIAIGISNFYPCVLLEGGDVQCEGAADQQPPCTPDWCLDYREAQSVGHFRVNLGQPAVAITTGALEHTCALLANGAVRCFGLWSDPVPNDALGSSFDLMEANGQDSWGPFHDIDLGTAP